jgi:uncharacterized protein (DUF1499 family)
MSLFSWPIRNWADTDEGGDPALAPVDLAQSPAELMQRVEAAVRSLPRWQVATVDPVAGILKATRRTLIFRFVDDVTVRLEPTGTGTRVHARSQSRVGKGDLGQNRRNLLELFGRLREV